MAGEELNRGASRRSEYSTPPPPAIQNPTTVASVPGAVSHWTEEAATEPGVRPDSTPSRT